jgi:hypothetical protein
MGQTRKKSGSVSGTHSEFSQFDSKIFAAVTVVTYQSLDRGVAQRWQLIWKLRRSFLSDRLELRPLLVA